MTLALGLITLITAFSLGCLFTYLIHKLTGSVVMEEHVVLKAELKKRIDYIYALENNHEPPTSR